MGGPDQAPLRIYRLEYMPHYFRVLPKGPQVPLGLPRVTQGPHARLVIGVFVFLGLVKPRHVLIGEPIKSLHTLRP